MLLILISHKLLNLSLITLTLSISLEREDDAFSISKSTEEHHVFSSRVVTFCSPRKKVHELKGRVSPVAHVQSH